MKLAKFKLIAGGLGGIAITCVEYIMAKDNVIFTDDVVRTRKVPFPHKFRQSISKLKYYFLVLTAHWIEPYNKYFDRTTHRIAPLPETGPAPTGQMLLIELMNKVNITGVVFTDKGFLLTGTIDSFGDKMIGLSTRLVTEEDDAGFYTEAIGMINSVFADVGLFFKEGKVIDDTPTSYLQELGYSEKENLGDLSEEELTERVLDAFQKRGGIVLMPADGGSIAIDNPGGGGDMKVSLDKQTGNVTLDTRTGNIDGKHLEDATQKMDPEVVDEKIKEIERIKNEKEAADSTAQIDPEIDQYNKKYENNSSEKPKAEVSAAVDSDREFPAEGISDADIQAAVGPITEELVEEIVPPQKTKKKKAGSTLASEKDFAAATGGQAGEDHPVDLTGAEFSEGNGPAVDDWSQEIPEGAESGLSQDDIDQATQQ